MEKIRTVRLAPYRKGLGPRFDLTLFDTHRSDSDGKAILAYVLRQDGKELFRGEDFHCSPLHGIDSDATVASLMGFLTLRPGDTDAEYFTAYNEAQLTFAADHAEALALEVSSRFGE